MRRLAPWLTAALVAAGFYWALEGGPETRRHEAPGSATRRALPDADAPKAASESRSESEPSPEPESVPVESRPETAPVREVVILEIVRENGDPIAAADLRITSETLDGSVAAKTDERGRAEVEAHAGATGTLLISPAASWPIEREIPLDSGAQRIVFPTGLTVAGHVRVGGLPPTETMRLVLSHGEGNVGPIFTDTDAEGRFEFYGLDQKWNGNLQFPFHFRLPGQEDWDSALELEAPNPALLIRLDERPGIKGRVLRGSPPAPMESASVYLRTGGQDWSRTNTDSAGRFRLVVWGDADQGEVQVNDKLGIAKHRFVVPGPFAGVRDVGDIVLEGTRQLPFIVRDAESRPVEGALGRIDDSASFSGTTDAEGRSSILAAESASTLVVGKLGYSIAQVALLPGISTPVEVVLTPGNQLRIDVRNPDASVPSPDFVYVHLSSPEPMFAGTGVSTDPVLAGASGAGPSESGLGPPAFAQFNPNDEGGVNLGGFVPGAQIEIELRSRKLEQVLDRGFVVMDAVGKKTVTVRTPHEAQSIAGTIRKRNGEPLDEACAYFWRSGATGSATDYGHNAHACTGDAGAFLVTGIYVPTVDVLVVKSGFVSLRKHAVPVPAPGASLDFILEPGLVLDIEVVDEHGRFLEDAEVWVRFPGTVDRDQPDPPELLDGRHRVTDLPPGALEINVAIGTTQVVVTHDTRDPVARVVVPTLGGAEIHWIRSDGDPEHCRFVVETLPARERVFEGAIPAEVTDHYLEGRVPPGLYFAFIEGYDPDSDEWHVLGVSGAFEIAAHQGTSVEVRR